MVKRLILCGLLCIGGLAHAQTSYYHVLSNGWEGTSMKLRTITMYLETYRIWNDIGERIVVLDHDLSDAYTEVLNKLDLMPGDMYYVSLFPDVGEDDYVFICRCLRFDQLEWIGWMVPK